MMGGDNELTLIHHLIKKGFALEYIINLDVYSKRIFYASMLAELEEKEVKEWQL